MARERIQVLVLLGVALLLAPWGVFGHPRSFSPLVKKHRAQVVHIGTRNRREQSPGGGRVAPFPGGEELPGLGSGFIIDPGGLIVTNHHVVANSEIIEVILENGGKFPATVVGTDPRTDLALIKIEAQGLPAAKFGDSSLLEVGDWVLAIGNPLGLDYSVTAGIISAKGRNIFEGENQAYGEFLQTDAAINPGNSGGPLFDLNGRVVGVNTAISSRGYGIGFAVPSNLVVEVVRHLREHGEVLRGWLGVVIQQVTREISQTLRLPGRTVGVLVEQAPAFAPAFQGGLRPGDVVTRFGRERVTKVTQLQKLVAFAKPGSRVNISALRRDQPEGPWKAVEFTVRIAKPPGQTGPGQLPVLQRLGVEVRVGPPGLRRGKGRPADQGVEVRRVVPGSLAGAMGLKYGDVILEADRRSVASPTELADALRQAGTGRVSFLVRRGQTVLFLVAPAPE